MHTFKSGTKSNVEASFDKNQYFIEVETNRQPSQQTGDNVVGSLDFVAGSFDFLHIHEHVLI